MYDGKSYNNDNGMDAIDFYDNYQEYIDTVAELGANSFRMSISWARIVPDGDVDNGINRDGIDFYNNVINYLLKKGITPFVTINHFDMPATISLTRNNEAHFLSEKTIDLYIKYADLCFQTFGDRVKNWITFNEPRIMVWYGFGLGYGTPGRCSPDTMN